MPIPPQPQPTPSLRTSRRYTVLALLWTVVVLLLTLTPAAEMPSTPVWELLSFDTAAHAGVFFVLAGLYRLALRRQRRWPWVARHLGLAVFVGCTLLGAAIEALQYNMKLGRHGEWTDLLSDAIGAALGVALAQAWVRRKPRAVGVACWVGLLGATVLTPTPAQAQDVARARQTIEKLASPGLHGRGYVQQGEHKAAAYLRGRFRELKLMPLAPEYTQRFGLDVNTFPGELKLAVTHTVTLDKVITQDLVPGKDFIVAPESGSTRGLRTASAVRLDTLCFTDAHAQQLLLQQARRWLSLPATGAFLVLTARDEKRLASLPPSLRQALDSLPNRIVLVPKLTASLAPVQASGVRFEALNKPAVWYPPSQSGPVDLVVYQVDAQLQRNYQTQNLAAVIRGKAQPDSFLVVSAHYDHLGMMGRQTYFPGANDNASGVALLLELAAHYARPENRPGYSVVFLLFGAEEAGLVGSRYFVAHPLIPLKSIKFLVNLDLLGTGEQGATVVNGRMFEAPYRRLVALNDAHHYLPALGARGRAANSDHFPFSEAGVPAFFIYTRGGSTAYHDVNDQPAALSLAGFVGAFGLVRDFINELGGAPAQR
jgi:aminopeptidase YwaD